jgi:hypothetical protein
MGKQKIIRMSVSAVVMSSLVEALEVLFSNKKYDKTFVETTLPTIL